MGVVARLHSDAWGRPIVKAGIGTPGTVKPATLLIDTGASLNVLRPKFASKGTQTQTTVCLAGFGGGNQKSPV